MPSEIIHVISIDNLGFITHFWPALIEGGQSVKAKIVFHTPFDQEERVFTDVDIRKEGLALKIAFADRQGDKLDVILDRRDLRKVLDLKFLMSL